jgi:hypothetical protein
MLLGCAGVAHRFHTPGMGALRSLARSKIVSANCTGYVVTDPNTPPVQSGFLEQHAIRVSGPCERDRKVFFFLDEVASVQRVG